MKNHENKSVEVIRNEELIFVISTLIDVAKYYEISSEKQFSLNPKNLIYNIHSMVELKEIDEPVKGKKMDFIEQYKALVGFCLQKKYSFDDYYMGGMNLLKKNTFLKKFYSLTTVDEIVDVLKEEYENVYTEKYVYNQEISRSKYRMIKVYTSIITLLLIIISGYTIYNYIHKTAINDACINAYEAYYLNDYVKVIDSLENVDNQDMSKRIKCIAAIAFVKTENLAQKQKENILNDINTLNTDIYMDYWIYLGRSDVKNAENIAKQLSDDELLLYAYMRELTLIKDDTSIDGEVKASRIELLEGEIEKLKKVYEAEETE